MTIHPKDLHSWATDPVVIETLARELFVASWRTPIRHVSVAVWDRDLGANDRDPYRELAKRILLRLAATPTPQVVDAGPAPELAAAADNLVVAADRLRSSLYGTQQ